MISMHERIGIMPRISKGFFYLNKAIRIIAVSLTIFAATQAVATEKVYYSVSANVAVNAREVMSPKAIALANNPVRTELLGSAASPSYRLEYTVTPVAGKEDSEATIHVSFFNKSMDNWVLRAQPSAVVRLGDEATISLPYQEGTSSPQVTDFNLTVVRIAESALAAQFHGKIPDPSLCPPDTSANSGAVDIRPLAAAKQALKSACCNSGCTDGSGNSLKCCGAVSCSGCGTSCTP